MIHVCQVCPEKFDAYPSEGRKYCSLKCAAIGRTYLENGSCRSCNRKIKNDGRPRVYCDEVCNTVYMRKEGVAKRTVVCEHCEGYFIRAKGREGLQKYCSRSCVAKSRWNAGGFKVLTTQKA